MPAETWPVPGTVTKRTILRAGGGGPLELTVAGICVGGSSS